MQIHHPSLDSGWLNAVEDRRFYHFGSMLCAALKNWLLHYGRMLIPHHVLSVWNKFQTHKAAESDSSVEKEGKKEDYFVVNLITPEVVIAICIYLFP